MDDRKMHGLTLAEQIAQLEDPAPVDFDPENVDRGDTLDLGGRGPVDGREHYVDVGPSELRKTGETMTDTKYETVKTSRNKLLEDQFVGELGDESDEEEREEQGLDGSQKGVASLRIDDGSSVSASVIEDDDFNRPMSLPPQNDDNTESSPPKERQVSVSQPEKSLASSLLDIRAADKLKGKAVSHQLAVWDSLIDARIRLQKVITATNKLPSPDRIIPYLTSSAGRVAAHAFLSEALKLSDDLFDLRHTLFIQKDSNLPPRKKRRVELDTEDPQYVDLIAERTAEMATFDSEMHAEKLAVLQKWSAKVQAVAPSALLASSRDSFKGPGHLKSAAELVNEALQDSDKAVQRTWGRVSRIGGVKRTGDDGDEETFDDRDFYQSLLRDVIESKGGRDGKHAAEIYASIKKRRKKKPVDTKASKGRKLRYEVHEKLQHFMVPAPVRGTWHDEQVDELFASLLGKGFEEQRSIANNSGTNEKRALQGFRIFG